MPLPLTVSCSNKIQIGFTFLVPAHPGSPGKRAVKRVCVCVLLSELVITSEKSTTLTLLTETSVIENGSSKSYRQWPSFVLRGVNDSRLSSFSGGRGTRGFSPGFIASVSYTHARLTALCLGLPRWASTTGISWAICKSAPRSRQITTPAPHHLVFYRPDALPAAQPTASKHWRHPVSK